MIPNVPNTPAPNLPVGGGAGAGAGAGVGVLLPFTAAPAADAAPTPETIADEGTPLAQAPEAQPTTETIADDENPLSTFDKPVCGTHMWMFLGIILTVIYGAAVALRRLSDTRDIEKMDKDLTGSESAPAKQNAGYASHTA